MERDTRKIARYTALFFILLSTYLLTFCGIASTDDEQLFSAITENLSFHNGYSALSLFGNDRLQGNTGGIEPLHSILAVPAFLLAHRINLGKAQVVFLLPAIYTALTSMLLAIIAEIKGAASNTSIILGFAYGLGTIAFPYARTNFREPLSALFLTTALLFLELAPKWSKSLQRYFYPLLCLAFLTLSILTKITTVVIFPIFLFAYILQLTQGKNKHPAKFILLAGVIAAMLPLIFLWLPQIFPSSSLNRFSLRFMDYLSYTLPRLPHDHFWLAIAGLLFSPGKGIFIYSPILLLALAAPLIKNEKNTSWLIQISPLLALSFIQSYIYNDHWWNITWGTRALLPALPMALLASLPAMDAGVNHHNWKIRITVFTLLGSGILIQIGRLLTSDPVFVNWVVPYTGRKISAATQWDLNLIPLFRHWQLGFTGPFSDIAWLHIPNNSALLSIIHASIAAISIGLGLLFLISKKRNSWYFPLFTSLSILTLTLTPFAARSDTRYYGSVERFKDASAWVCSNTENSDLILIDSYLHPLWWFYSNFGCSGPEWVGLPYLHTTAVGEKRFYPRTSETAHLILSRLDASDQVFLLQITTENGLRYSDELEEMGFSIESILLNNSRELEIFRIER